MDSTRFDAATRALGAKMTRRGGIASALGLVLRGLLGEDAAAAGPCGDGSAKANACSRNSDCCTKYCVGGKCKCKPAGMACAKAAHCCSGACKNGTCAKSTGGCGPATCNGCCDGSVCRSGTTNADCGTGGKACASCGSSRMCIEGVCGTIRICGAFNCQTGCCRNGQCLDGLSTLACGYGGETCQECGGSRPYCEYWQCVECRSNKDCAAGSCLSGRCRVLKSTASFGAYDQSSSSIESPQGLHISRNGNRIWVADAGLDHISVWDRSADGWRHRSNFGKPGTGIGAFKQPSGVWATLDETVYVADTFNNRVSVWKRIQGQLLDGWTYLGEFGDTGDASTSLVLPIRVAASDTGDVVIVGEMNRDGASLWRRSGDTWTYEQRLGAVSNMTYGVTGVWISADGRDAYLLLGNQGSIWNWYDYSGTGDWHDSPLTFTGAHHPTGLGVGVDTNTFWTTDEISGSRGQVVAVSGLGLTWNVRYTLDKLYGQQLGTLSSIASTPDDRTVAFIEYEYLASRIHILTFS